MREGSWVGLTSAGCDAPPRATEPVADWPGFRWVEGPDGAMVRTDETGYVLVAAADRPAALALVASLREVPVARTTPEAVMPPPSADEVLAVMVGRGAGESEISPQLERARIPHADGFSSVWVGHGKSCDNCAEGVVAVYRVVEVDGAAYAGGGGGQSFVDCLAVGGSSGTGRPTVVYAVAADPTWRIEARTAQGWSDVGAVRGVWLQELPIEAPMQRAELRAVDTTGAQRCPSVPAG